MKIVAIILVVAVCLESIHAIDEKSPADSNASSPGKDVQGDSANVPFLQKNKSLVISAKDGKIMVDNVALFDYDDELKKGKVHFVVNQDNDISINGRLVMRKRPEDRRIISKEYNYSKDGVAEFYAKINHVGVISIYYVKASPANEIDVPVLTKKSFYTVVGKNGKVFVNDKPLFDFDDDLKKGKLQLVVTDDSDVLVNGQYVLKNRPGDEKTIRYYRNIIRENVKSFKVTIRYNGGFQFTLF